jgi:hypothetical protein
MWTWERESNKKLEKMHKEEPFRPRRYTDRSREAALAWHVNLSSMGKWEIHTFLSENLDGYDHLV